MVDEDPYLVGARRWLGQGGGTDPGPQPGALDVPTKDELRIAQLARDVADLRREVEETDATVATNAAAHNKLRRGAIISDLLLAIGGLALAWLVVFGG